MKNTTPSLLLLCLTLCACSELPAPPAAMAALAPEPAPGPQPLPAVTPRPLNGVWIAAYHPNGVVEEERTFRDGSVTALRRWHPNRELAISGRYDGVFEDTGTKRDGSLRPVGRWLYWHEDGRLAREDFHDADGYLVSGRSWHRDGRLARVLEPGLKRKWSPAGVLVFERVKAGGVTIHTWWRANGAMSLRYALRDGLLDGWYTTWNLDGSPGARLLYARGELQKVSLPTP